MGAANPGDPSTGFMTSFPEDGLDDLDYYPQPADTIEWFHTANDPSSERLWFMFGLAQHQNSFDNLSGLAAGFEDTGNQIVLVDLETGVLDSAAYPSANPLQEYMNTEYGGVNMEQVFGRHRIEWAPDGEIVYTYDIVDFGQGSPYSVFQNVASVSATVQKYLDNRGVGWRGGWVVSDDDKSVIVDGLNVERADSDYLLYGGTGNVVTGIGAAFGGDPYQEPSSYSLSGSPLSSSTPTLHNGELIVPAGSGSGGLEESIFVLDPEDGSVGWVYNGGEQFGNPPVVDNGVVYAASTEGTVYALDRSDGTEIWTHSSSNRIEGPIAVGTNHVFYGTQSGSIGGGNGVTAINRSDGTQSWNSSRGDMVFGGVSIYDGKVYALMVANGIEAFALDPSNGSEIWTEGEGGQYLYNDSRSFWQHCPVKSDGLVYTAFSNGSSSGIARAYDDSGGFSNRVWETSLGNTVYAPAAVSSNYIFFSRNGAIEKYDKASGDHMWTQLGGVSGEGPPTLYDGKLYHTGGTIGALDAETNSLSELEVWNRSDLSSGAGLTAGDASWQFSVQGRKDV